MNNQNRNLILILLAIALFTGTVIELNEGSTAVGVLLFITSIVLLSKIDFKNSDYLPSLKMSKFYFPLGVIIVLADLYYNFTKGGMYYGTLDIMIIFFGLTLIVVKIPNTNISRVSRFGMYFSSAFIFLYIIFYTMFNALNIDLMDKFDHYFLLLPAVWILKLAGLPIKIISMEGVQINGIEQVTVMIADPCSGLYSMFLLIGIVLGYSRIEKMENKRTIKMLGLSIFIAHLSNMFRIIVLFLTANYYGSETMLKVHTHLGWVLFAFMAALIIYLLNPKK